MPSKNFWSREELILAFNLYLKLPFGKMHKHTPEIIELANLLGRTPSSISMRLGNFASIDPYHQERGVGGLKGGMNQVKPIWDEFANNREVLIFESERILAEKENQTIDDKFISILDDIKDLKGEVRLREVKTCVNQNFFRQLVLANYSSKCALTCIDIPELLFASHIIPWSKNEQERLNPENGICLSALYDKAFDKGLIGINEKHEVIISKDLKQNQNKEFYKTHFSCFENAKIKLPERFLPNKNFLQYHLDEIFSLRNK